MTPQPSRDPAALRHAAEARRHAQAATRPPATEADPRRLAHELEVHQIELEMQNEELIATRSALAAELENYTELYDFAPVGYFTLSAAGTIRRANLTGAALVDVDRAALAGRRFGLLVADADRLKFGEFLTRVFTGADRHTCEVTLLRTGAQPIAAHLTAQRSGDLPECRLVVLDISARRQAEAALASSLRDTFDLHAAINAHAIVAITDLQGKITFVNDKFCAISRYAREELLGQDHRLINSGYHPKAFFRELWRIIAAGKIWQGEIKNRAKDGSFYWVDTTIVPLSDEQGKPRHYVAIRADITNRKRAEETLRESEARFRAVFEQAAVGVARVAPDGRWLEVNGRLAAIVGYTREELLLKSFQDITHPEDLATDLDQVRQMLAGEIDYYTLEKRYFRRDGLLVWINLAVSLVRDAAGAPLYFISVVEDITARKLAEAAAQKQGVLQRAIFNSAKFSSIATDARGVIQIFNVGAEQMLGYTAAEVVNTLTPADLSDPRDLQARAQTLSGELSTPIAPGFEALVYKASRGVEDIYELTYLRKGGSRFPAVVSVTALRDAQEAIIGYLLIGTDNTERGILAEAMPQIVWITRPDGWNIYFNQQWMDYTGLTFAESLGHGWNTPFHPDDQRRAFEAWQRATATIGTYALECRLRRADGVYRWWLIRGVPLRNAAGQLIKWIGTCTDIHDLKQAEAELVAAKNHLQTTLDAIPDLLFEVGADGVIHRYHAHRGDLLAAPPAVFLGKNMAEVLPPAAAQVCSDSLREAENMGWSAGAVYSLPLPTGETWFELSIAAMPTEDRSDRRFILLARDVTARRHAEEEVQRLNAELELRVIARTAQLEAANRELEAFSYSVSHDLRAPLRGMHGYIRMLQEDYGPRLDAEANRRIAVVTSEAQRMGCLIDDLLAFSRAGRLPIARTTVDMTALVRVVFQQVTERLRDPAPRLELSALPSARGDPALLRQVWVNLLSNAVKFSRHQEAPVIAVGASEVAGLTTYFVKDNGVGFDEKYAHKLFGVFQRLHSEIEYEGTGVGLAIVQRVIHRHGGKVWGESKPGAGATFFFTLPPSRDPPL